MKQESYSFQFSIMTHASKNGSKCVTFIVFTKKNMCITFSESAWVIKQLKIAKLVRHGFPEQSLISKNVLTHK